MPTIAYNAIEDHLQRIAADAWPAVTLIHGEEMLCEQAFDAIVQALIPEADRAVCVDSVDGASDSVSVALDILNTYALLSSTKLVVLRDARLFYSSKAGRGLREKILEAAQRGDLKKASRPFLNLMSLTGLAFEDLAAASNRKKIAEDIDGQPAAWFARLIDYCRDEGLGVPQKRDDTQLLTNAMQKGFPPGHRLIITTDFVDRRKTLFKAIDKTGLVVDCSVPKGETRADRTAQDAVIQATIDEMLDRAGKQLAVNARRRLVQWTGFDLRTLAGNLERLISFVGDRRQITDADVTSVLRRTRKDPIFAFTNALADRNLPDTLFFMQSLLDDGMHPLQLLAAAANQIRRLLVAKDFIARDRGRSWSAQMSFAQFKAAAYSAVRAHDRTYASLIESWASILNPDGAGKKRKPSTSSDLVLARNPNSPYPVYQTLKKADGFSLPGLFAAVKHLSETDRRIKSTGQEPRLLLEAFLIGLRRNQGQTPNGPGE
ncbi:MAG: hypothetical protein PVH26_04690 [Desulfosarcina sp.]|jgi:DNA polymerase-3 subunit delta